MARRLARRLALAQLAIALGLANALKLFGPFGSGRDHVDGPFELFAHGHLESAADRIEALG